MVLQNIQQLQELMVNVCSVVDYVHYSMHLPGTFDAFC